MRFVRAVELQGLRNLRKSATAMIKEARAFAEPYVFMSHSHRDRDDDVLSGAISLFEVLGAEVYLDYQDDSLPAITSARTAMRLRRRIQRCERVVVAASGHLRDSRWVPWEIGYADGEKSPSHIALLPIDDDVEGVTVEQEYLAMYPSIRVHENKLIVFDPRDRKFWSLEDWLWAPLE